jgi:hypothetical protein
MARSHRLTGEPAQAGCHAGEAQHRRADTAGRGRIRRRQDWKTGAALTLNGQVGLGATPYIVPSTHAGAVFQPSRRSSPSLRWFGVDRGNACPFFPVRRLPRPGGHLQLLRSGSDLLRRRLCAKGASQRATGRRQALPDEPPWPHRPCLAASQLSGPAKKGDASGFTAASAG